jgi:hypothetical protein
MEEQALKLKRPKPKLRCPACEAEVTLPAAVCPNCQVDLRLGYLKKKRPRLKLKTAAWLGIQICAFVFVVNLLWKHVSWNKPAPSIPAAAYNPASLSPLTPEARRESIAAAPIEFQRLAEENPLLLLPYIYVYRAKTAAQRYQRQFEGRYSQMEEIDALQDLAIIQKASPAERQRILLNLWEEYHK